MVGFFDTLRIELEEYGISVTTVYPDFVATDMRVNAYGSDGQPLGSSPVQESKIMTAETCSRLILKAAAARKRDLLMSTRAKIGLWLKLIAPRMVDNIARKAIKRGV
jgi:short-subunit dehydrogenase